MKISDTPLSGRVYSINGPLYENYSFLKSDGNSSIMSQFKRSDVGDDEKQHCLVVHE